MTSTVKNLLVALPISVFLTLFGVAVKVFYDVFLPMLLHPQGDIASSSFINSKMVITIETIIFLIVFLFLQRHSRKAHLKLK